MSKKARRDAAGRRSRRGQNRFNRQWVNEHSRHIGKPNVWVDKLTGRTL